MKLGVDLGTYNSAAAAADLAGHIYVVPSRDGKNPNGVHVTQSFVRFRPSGEPSAIGAEARKAVRQDPESVVWGTKRLLARGFDQTDEDRRRFAYPIERGPDNGVVMRQGARTYRPEDIARMILEHLRTNAQDARLTPLGRGEQCDTIVLAHPAYFDSNQIAATRRAALDAGFEKVVMVTEPEAALLAYNEARGGGEVDAANILTIDWGAGTLDFVLSQRQEDGSLVNVATPTGSTHLGGLDMDDALVAACIGAFDLGRALADDPAAQSELRELVESMKVRLSTKRRDWGDLYIERSSTSIQIARARSDVPPGEEADWVVLEQALGEQPHSDADPTPILEQFRRQLRFVYTSTGFTPDQIDELVLIGGPMYMPCVRRVIGEEHTGNAKVQAQLAKIDADGFPLSPMEAVARGAALYTGNSLMQWMPPFAYGPVLGLLPGHRFGEVLIQRGAGQPQDDTSGFLSCHLQPGSAVTVGLFRVEHADGGPHYSQLGSYEWYPVVDDFGRARFRVQLELDSEGVVGMTFHDDVAGTPMRLDKMTDLQSTDLATPPAQFVQEDDPQAGAQAVGGLPQPQPEIKPEMVARRRAEALQDIDVVRPFAKHSPALREAISELEQALRQMPNGPTPQAVFAAVGNALTKLKHVVNVDQGIPDEKKLLLKGGK